VNTGKESHLGGGFFVAFLRRSMYITRLIKSDFSGMKASLPLILTRGVEMDVFYSLIDLSCRVLIVQVDVFL